MTTLISYKTSTGATGRCDAKCHKAKRQKCKCICGGLNHGVGQKQAAKNIPEHLKEILKEGVYINIDAISEINAQQELFPPKL
jgi:hypothetical protein